MNYDAEVEKLLKYLDVNPKDNAVQSVIEDYRPGKADAGQQGLHFFKGKIGRFRQAYTNDQQTQMEERFGVVLQKMGYKI
jgi:hypothetical protein